MGLTKNKILLKVVLSACLMLVSTHTMAQQVTISNNLLYDAWLTPNLRVGVRLAPHWSAGLTAGYNPWPSDENKSRKWKHLLVSPSVRYWTDSVNVRHFFGVNLIYSHYNVADVKFPFGLYKSVRDERRQGDLGALGVFYGYSWPIARHWNIEALIGAAVGYTKYNRYECGHCGTKIGEDKKWFVMPQAAINIVFNLPGRPKKVAQPVVEPVEPVQPVIQQEPELPKETQTVVVKPEPVEPAVHQLAKEYPVLAHISEYKAYDRSQVLRRDQRALFVYFQQGKSTIDTGWRANGETLDRVVRATQGLLALQDARLRKIQIVGLASFDGSQPLNERLARERALSLKRYIQDRLHVADDQFEVSFGGEDWADFRDQVEEEIANGSSKDAELRKVVEIIDRESDLARREQQIRKLNGGSTYQYIRQHLLADQRNSGYLRVFYDYVNANN